MKLKKTLFVSFAAAMALAGGATGAYAGEAKFENSSQILPCPNLELVNAPILGSDINNLDCSRNYKEEVRIKKVTKVEKEHEFIFAPKLEQAQGQGQGQGQEQDAKQGQKHEGEKEYKKEYKEHKEDKDKDDKKD
ncbi:MAG TPA: hypothetical protein VE546_10080 [Streptomyces sp.]|uniref:hypothetical protein n=1 Tax=Streptomyces sp. TaxID=1931 RepID=UPI002D483F9F|nr:hypothetical protein [Streptomyces sp.]HZG03908.1 hypothetical protein [Streptomyces sp.]